MILAIGCDLLFRSKIRDVARSDVTFVRDQSGLSAVLTPTTPVRALVDCNSKSFEGPEIIRALIARWPGIEIVAYGSHVDGDALASAKAAGAHRVMARSQFVKELVELTDAALIGQAASAEGNAPRKLPELGASKLTVIVFLVLLGAIGYVSYKVLPMYYAYYELQAQFEQILSVASMEDDKSIRQKLLYHVHKYDLPVDDADLLIERQEKHIKINLAWDDTLSIPWQEKEIELYTFHFFASAEGDF